MSKNLNISRAVVGIILGLIIIALALFIRNRIIASKQKPEIREQNSTTKVYTQEVQNTTIPVEITETGNLEALRKVELYSEVQGVMETGNKLFKPGQTYAAGQTIIKINDSEFASSLTAEKSVLYNLLAQAMPDLRLDYPEVFPKWEAFLSDFDIQSPVPPLPEFDSDREKFFINSKNIITTYYNIKNLETRLSKYTIKAPFYCAVTEALVFPGALIRPGQKLGEVLSPNAYEMVVSVDESYVDYLAVGKSVTLNGLDDKKSWKGRIARIDPTINTATQGIQVYIEVNGEGLREGMFLEAVIEGRSIEDSYEVSRKLLVEDNHIYLIRGDTLALVPVKVDFYKERTAIVTNLEEGTLLLKNAIPGAYEGMRVEIIDP